MYPWESIKSPENDTSLTLIHECMKRDHVETIIHNVTSIFLKKDKF